MLSTAFVPSTPPAMLLLPLRGAAAKRAVAKDAAVRIQAEKKNTKFTPPPRQGTTEAAEKAEKAEKERVDGVLADIATKLLKVIVEQAAIESEQAAIEAEVIGFRLYKCLEGHKKGISSIAVIKSNDSRTLIISGSHDKTIKIWDANTWELLHTLEGHIGTVTSIAVTKSNDSRTLIISGSQDKTIKIWDANTWELLQTLNDHTSKVESVMIEELKDNTYLIISINDSGHVKIRTLDNEEGALKTISPEGLKPFEPPHTNHTNLIRCFTIRKRGKDLDEGLEIITGSNDGTLKIWDAGTGALRRTLVGHNGYIRCVTTAELDGTTIIISGSDDGTIKTWDPNTGELRQTLVGHNHYIKSLMVRKLNDRRTVIISTCFNDEIKIWDANTGQLIQTLFWDTNRNISLRSITIAKTTNTTFSTIAGYSDGTIKIWGTNTGKEIQTLKLKQTHKGGCLMAIELNGRCVIISGSLDTTIKIWKAKNH